MRHWSFVIVPAAMAIMSIARTTYLPINISSNSGDFMKWYKKLYLGESIKQEKWVRFQIAFGKKPKGYYCISLSNCPENLLDIYPSQFLRTPDMNTDGIYIVGLASYKTEAFDVVRDIIEDVYVHTRGFDIKSYLGITV